MSREKERGLLGNLLSELRERGELGQRRGALAALRGGKCIIDLTASSAESSQSIHILIVEQSPSMKSGNFLMDRLKKRLEIVLNVEHWILHYPSCNLTASFTNC